MLGARYWGKAVLSPTHETQSLTPESPKTMIIQGGIHEDSRGKIIYANDFNLEEVKRMYHFHQSDISVIRAWQGHRREHKWFHCVKGSFEIQAVTLDDFDTPSRDLVPSCYTLEATNSQILHLPSGHANGFKAIEEDSILMVFSNMNVADSSADLIRFDIEYWNTKWKQ